MIKNMSLIHIYINQIVKILKKSEKLGGYFQFCAILIIEGRFSSSKLIPDREPPSNLQIQIVPHLLFKKMKYAPGTTLE